MKIKLLLAICTGVIYFLVLPEHNYALLALITYLPLLKAIENTTLKQTYGISLVAGMVMAALCTPWITDVGQTFFNIPSPFSILLVIEMAFIGAQPLAISMLVYRYLTIKQPSLRLWWLPLSVCTSFTLFSPLLNSLLAYGVIEQTRLIQTVDITGVLGLEFIIMTCNAILYQGFVRQNIKLTSPVVYLSFAMIITWLGYSQWRFQDISAQFSQMKKMPFAFIQPNRKPSLDAKLTNKIGQENLWEFKQYRQLDNNQVELAIWPEGTFYGYLYEQQSTNTINSLVNTKQLPLLFQDDYFSADGTIQENRAYFINGQQPAVQHYSKRELMPFGEKTDVLGYQYLLAALGIEKVPYQAGSKAAYFELNNKHLVPLICFEVLVSDLVANSLNSPHPYKVAVLLSQDGWYGDSVQQVSAHRTITQFRTIENRTPFIHIINNGPSHVVNVLGENSFTSGHLVQGSWQAQVLVPENITTFFKLYPTWFERLVQLLLVAALISTRRHKKEHLN